MDNREKIRRQAEGIERWLQENAPYTFDEQDHLDEGTEARAYWHHGRLTGLRDALKALPH